MLRPPPQYTACKTGQGTPASIVSVTAAADEILLFNLLKSSRTSPESECGPSAEAAVVRARTLFDALAGNRETENRVSRPQ